MSAPASPIATPTSSYPSAVSPVQWMRTFAYTPDSARIQNGYRHPELALVAVENRVPRSEDDALPTHFHSHSRIQSRAVGGGSDAYDSDPSLTVPAKRKRRSRGREDLSATDGWSTQGRTRKTRRRTRCTSTSGHTSGGASHSHVPAPLTPCPQSRRVVLDAVEIVSKKRSRGRSLKADPRPVRAECPTTESPRKKASSHYPSPPISRADRDVVVRDGNSSPHILRPDVVEREERASPEPTSPMKTSKYFARVSAPSTCSVPEHFPVPTPPSSPVLTIPVHIESSDFEYPPRDVSFDESTMDESRRITRWYNSPGLFDDLMIMLRRLKPILVQESVRSDPWKVLIAVRLLNVTTGKAAIPVFCKIISRWPTPQDLVHAPQDELVELLRPLGLYNKRASWLKDVSERFLEDRQAPSRSLASLLSEEGTVPDAPWLHYPGVGPYALDSLRMFCASDKDAWKRVMPRDKELVRYLRWRWAVEEGKVWYPEGKGVIGEVDVPYLITLVDELAAHYDSAIAQVVISNGNVYVSGSIGCDDEYNIIGGIESQSRAALNNMKTLLEGAGSGLEHVLKVTVYMTYMARDFDVFNDIYREYFPNPETLPVRTCIGVATLPMGAFVEVECIAEVPSNS
ncbi:hypothetical protein J3R83DRAFT_8143 [Lanmaoa asiatica]|nr:hypothetical protein J3R83DRAFT_8143 [Lanmaoa asiatica]